MITHVSSTRNAAAEMQSQSQCSVESLRGRGRRPEIPLSTGEMEGSNVLRAGRGKGKGTAPREGTGLHKGRTKTTTADDGRGWVLNGTN